MRDRLDDWLTDWTLEHERVAYIASEVVTVLALLASVALLVGGAQALVWWVDRMTRTDAASLLLVVVTVAALLVVCWRLTDWWLW